MARFIILHSKTLKKKQVAVVLEAIKGTGARLLDDSDDTYLFEGDTAKAKEIISPMIGEWSITPLREPDAPPKA